MSSISSSPQSRQSLVHQHRFPWWKKIAYSTGITAGFFLLLEAILAFAGVRKLSVEEDPYVGFSGQLPLFVEQVEPNGPRVRVTASNKLRYFNQQQFSAQKEPGTFRIFALGGSTTYGHPYDDRTSFCGWLREFLREADGKTRWEVVNAGGISYASYRVAHLMEELVNYQPDLFIIYTGHNEHLEQRTYGDIKDMPETLRDLGAILGKTRVYSWMQRTISALRPRKEKTKLAAEVKTVLDNALDDSIGPESYRRDDELQASIESHFRISLDRMVRIAREVNANVIFVTPASNLRDCGPFRSQPALAATSSRFNRWQTAMSMAKRAIAGEKWSAAQIALDEAISFDPRFAEAHYDRGHVLLRQENFVESQKAFVRALEEDVCPLRATPRLQQIVRDVSQRQSVSIVDFAASVELRAAHGIPGDAQFLDHVHPTIDEHRLLALDILDEMERLGMVRKPASWSDIELDRVKARVESRIDARAHGAALCTVAQVYNWAGRLDESGRIARRALELIPDNAEAHFLAGYDAARRGILDDAVRHYSEAVRLQPNHAVAQNNLGRVHEARGDLPAAIEHYKAALAAEPDYAIGFNNLGGAYMLSGDFPSAQRELRRALELRPEYAAAHENMGLWYARQGMLAPAAQSFREATRLDPNSSTAFSNLGSALASLGDLQEARQAFETALALDPESEHARRNLQRLRQQVRY